MARRSGGNDKYLRLTGLWQSKKNNALFTGKLKTEQLEGLEKKVAEALESDAPLLFGLWENDKKESKRDPEFSLQCFVGDSEEKPTSRRDRDSGSSRRSSRDKEDDQDNDNQDDPEEDNQEEGDNEPEERSTRKKGTSTRKSTPSRDERKRTTKKRADW